MTWTHALTILQDILYGVHKAIEHGLLDLTTFNLEDYEFYEQVQNGDWNWITPEFLAFASPKDRDYALALSNGQAPPRQWRTTNPTLRNTVSYFRSHRISLVIRLNNPLYDKALFEDAGINHVDLYFDDGSNPSDEIVRSFISHADGAIRRADVVDRKRIHGAEQRSVGFVVGVLGRVHDEVGIGHTRVDKQLVHMNTESVKHSNVERAPVLSKA